MTSRPSFLENTANHGLSFVAKDKATGRVVAALLCEVYDPDEEPPAPFEGELAPFNHILPFLDPADEKLKEVCAFRLGRPVQKGDLVHLFLGGVSALSTENIFVSLAGMVIEKASQGSYQGMFAEATNWMSADPLKQNGFKIPMDVGGRPIRRPYKDDPVFCKIPEDKAMDLEILYRPITLQLP